MWLPFVLWLAREEPAWTFAKYPDEAAAQHALLRCQLASMAAEPLDVMRRLRGERVMVRACTLATAALGLHKELR